VNSSLSSNKVLYIDHPAVRKDCIEARAYQEEIAKKASQKNMLVVLPTALGKTIIAALVVADFLYQHPKMRILMMAPTRPLVLQHLDSFYHLLRVNREDMAFLTGVIPPEQRRMLWRGEAKLFFATPQTVKNDLEEGRVRFTDFSLLIFDEAHRATKDYAYGAIARRYINEAPWPTILGLTASPGSNKERIEDVCSKLYIEQIEYRSEEHADILPYIHPVEVQWIRVELPETYKELVGLARKSLDEYLGWLREHGFPIARTGYVSRRELLALGEVLRERLKELTEDMRGPLYTALVKQATSLTLFHAQELLETQGMSTFLSFLDKISRNPDEKTSYRRLKQDPSFIFILKKAEELREEDHPKVKELVRIVREQVEEAPLSKVLIFTQYRDTASHLVEKLNDVPNLRVARFVGQASKEEDVGLSQKEQTQILSEYRSGNLNVLVATCIAEEGLDIPDVDLVIFYEPIPSEIRYIQRKGRTGRRHVGKAIVLIAEDTVDVAYQMASLRRVEKMRRIIERLNKQLTPVLRLGGKPKPTPELFTPSSEEEERQKKIEEEGAELAMPRRGHQRISMEGLRDPEETKGLGSVEEWVWKEVMKFGKNGVEMKDLASRASEKGWNPSVLKTAVSRLASSGNIMRASFERLISPSSLVLENGVREREACDIREIRIEKIFPERAVVCIDEKWRARMDVWNFEGPSSLVKRNARFLAKIELYREPDARGDSVLSVRVKEIVQILS